MALRKKNINALTVTIDGNPVRLSVRSPGPSDMKAYFEAQGKEWDIYQARIALGQALVTDINENDIEYETAEGWKPLTAQVPGWKEILREDHFPLLAAVGFFFERQLQPMPAAPEDKQIFFDKSSRCSRAK